MILEINTQNPQKRLINQVCDCLKNGGVIIYPTDTYYGIGCDIKNKKAIERVNLIKKRTKKTPFSFICSDLTHISEYAKVSNISYRILKRLLPGPYTFILEGSKEVPKMMLTNRKTAGIRVPDNNICTEIVKNLKNPVISTTASDENEEPFEFFAQMADHYENLVDIIIDGGDVPNGPSSVISLISDQPEILRRGIGIVDEFE
ncbi:MAG: threonylcarbamoyl-AMP synthase [Desulfobacteraceae bacterium]|nr:threonylcarbamoyl-AMP synthase [Desulfobacteraceae bacterium]